MTNRIELRTASGHTHELNAEQTRRENLFSENFPKEQLFSLQRHKFSFIRRHIFHIFQHHHHNSQQHFAVQKVKLGELIDWPYLHWLFSLSLILARVIELEIFIIADNSIAQHIVNSLAGRLRMPAFSLYSPQTNTYHHWKHAEREGGTVKSIYEIKFFGLFHIGRSGRRMKKKMHA